MGIMMQVSVAFLSGTHALLIISTRHYVISEVDMYVSTQRTSGSLMAEFVYRGEPILVKQIPFIKDEDIEKLKDRVHEKEHEAIVTATNIAISRLKERSSSSTNQAA